MYNKAHIAATGKMNSTSELYKVKCRHDNGIRSRNGRVIKNKLVRNGRKRKNNMIRFESNKSADKANASEKNNEAKTDYLSATTEEKEVTDR